MLRTCKIQGDCALAMTGAVAGAVAVHSGAHTKALHKHDAQVLLLKVCRSQQAVQELIYVLHLCKRIKYVHLQVCVHVMCWHSSS